MAKAYKTNYFDPLGNAHTGYIIDGKTYKDPEGKQRVEKGSVVETAAGNYTLTSAGGIKTDYGKDSLDVAKNYIDKMTNDSVSRNEAIYNSRKAEIDARKRQAHSTYNKAVQNEYLKAMQSRKNMAQLLKAQGASGGMSESIILQNQLNYENAVNALKETLNDNLFDLDNELLKLRNETDYNIAEEKSELDKLYLQYINDYYDDVSDSLESEAKINADNYRSLYLEEKEEERFNKEMEFEREKFDHQIMDDERNYNLNVIRTNKSSGGDTEFKRLLEEAEIRADFGDFSLLGEIYGWDQDTLNAARADYEAKMY